jgi:HEAT repeat protein
MPNDSQPTPAVILCRLRELEQLSPEQITTCINHFFTVNADPPATQAADRIHHALATSDSLMVAASDPYLLSLLCQHAAIDPEGPLPDTATAILDASILRLANRRTQNIFSQAHLKLFAALAFAQQCKHAKLDMELFELSYPNARLKRADALAAITKLMEIDAPLRKHLKHQHGENAVAPTQLLKYILAGRGLLREIQNNNGERLIDFVDGRIREFLAGKYLADLVNLHGWDQPLVQWAGIRLPALKLLRCWMWHPQEAWTPPLEHFTALLDDAHLPPWLNALCENDLGTVNICEIFMLNAQVPFATALGSARLRRVLEQNETFRNVLDRRIEQWLQLLQEQAGQFANPAPCTGEVSSPVLNSATLVKLHLVPGVTAKIANLVITPVTAACSDDDDDDRIRQRNLDRSCFYVSRIRAALAVPQLLGALAKLMQGGDYFPAFSAARIINNIGPAAATPDVLSALMAMLKAEDWLVASNVNEALRGIGHAAATPEMLGSLAAMLTGDQTEHASRAAGAVLWIGPKAATPEILAGLTKLCGCGVKHAAERAAAALAALQPGSLKEKRKPGPVTPDEIKHLCELLDNVDIREVTSGCVEIIEIGEDAAAPEILAALANLMGSTVRRILGPVIATVLCIGPKAATPEILAGLTSLCRCRVKSVAEDAQEALIKIQSVPKSAMYDPPAYRPEWSLNDISDNGLYIGGGDNPSAARLDALADALTSESCTKRIRAAEIIRDMGEEALLNSRILTGLVDALNPDVSAKEARTFMETPRNLHRYDIDLRAEAAFAISELGPPALADKRVLPALARNLSIENPCDSEDTTSGETGVRGIDDDTSYDWAAFMAQSALSNLAPKNSLDPDMLLPLAAMLAAIPANLSPISDGVARTGPWTRVTNRRAAAHALTLLGLYTLASAAVAHVVSKNSDEFLGLPESADLQNVSQSIVRGAQFHCRLVALLDQPQS